jgi:hypothetical protein
MNASIATEELDNATGEGVKRRPWKLFSSGQPSRARIKLSLM